MAPNPELRRRDDPEPGSYAGHVLNFGVAFVGVNGRRTSVEESEVWKAAHPGPVPAKPSCSVLGFDTAGSDEGVKVRDSDTDVTTDLEVGDSSFGDQSSEEPHGGPEPRRCLVDVDQRHFFVRPHGS
jgi:hypothetical protein